MRDAKSRNSWSILASDISLIAALRVASLHEEQTPTETESTESKEHNKALALGGSVRLLQRYLLRLQSFQSGCHGLDSASCLP